MPDDLIHVSGPVWYFPADSADRIEPNIGVITTPEGSVLVDSGNSPGHARRVLAAIEAAGMTPVLYTIFTHHHWDHTFGAQVFHAPVIAHERCSEALAERYARSWTPLSVEEEIRRNPLWEWVYRNMQRAVENWDQFQLVMPSITFTRGLTLYAGGVTLQIRHVGGLHAADSLMVVIPEAQTAFVGDSYYGPVQWQRNGSARSGPERAIVQRLLADETIAYYVDGHKPVVKTREAFATYADAAE